MKFSTPSLALLAISACFLILVDIAKAESNSSKQQQQQQHDTLGQLLISKFSNAGRLEENAVKSFGGQKATQLTKKHQLQSQEQMKDGLKKKWHKLVDEIIDSQLSSSQMMLVNEPVVRRRNKPTQDEEASADSSNESLVLVVKRKPSFDAAEAGHSFGNILSPLVSNSQQIGQAAQAQQARQPANILEHQRNILNDGFGIMRDSIFTTNNHLGPKGVPNFGSDEQF